MKNNRKQLEKKLNSGQPEERLAALKKLSQLVADGEISPPETNEKQVNNHIHTTYSFSPYSPTRSVWEAYKAGLVTAGLMDHDSIKGAQEFLEAGEIIDLAVTVGLECRANFSQTPLANKTINHPDQKGTAYIALHGVPHQNIDTVQEFFAPYRKERNKRNRSMVENLNDYFAEYGIEIDFAQDVVPLSEYESGGTITERHLLFATAGKLIDRFGRGESLVQILEEKFAHVLTPRLRSYLVDEDNQYYRYDLLGLLKKDTSYFYIAADRECPEVGEVVKLARQVGAIMAYAYLGDVEKSVTGDKKAQKFEDDYLPLLFEVLDDLGFDAIAYMPTRNTMAQLKRLKELCNQNDFFQICGEDINSPRQSFVCEALKKDEFSNLIDSTWALIGHEQIASRGQENGMFTAKTKDRYPDLKKRIQIYKEMGQLGHDTGK
ncbi:MAG: PHP domain-containing protein [bacterium]